ncbi:MAG: hypothetical protein ACLTV1_13885 [Christensenellales bacterium]
MISQSTSHISEDYPGRVFTAQNKRLCGGRRWITSGARRLGAGRRIPCPHHLPRACFRTDKPPSAGGGPDDPYNAADFTGPEDTAMRKAGTWPTDFA